jgi:putative transcriptional regulator
MKLTQAALGEAAEVSRRTINNVENDIFVPSAELALRLAHVLGASVEELFFLESIDGSGIWSACGHKRPFGHTKAFEKLFEDSRGIDDLLHGQIQAWKNCANSLYICGENRVSCAQQN